MPYLENIEEIVKGIHFTVTPDSLKEWLKIHLREAYQVGFVDGSHDQLRKREQDLEQSIYGREALIRGWNPEDSIGDNIDQMSSRSQDESKGVPIRKSSIVNRQSL